MAILTSVSSPRDMYSGLSTTLLRNVPYNAVQFGTFSVLSQILPSSLAGAAAGICTALVTTPIDVVNTRS